MLKLILATKNQGKIEEMRTILKESDIRGGLEIHTLFCYPDIPDITEDGTTFEENAKKKALTVSKFTGLIAIAMIQALKSMPLLVHQVYIQHGSQEKGQLILRI